MNCNGPLPRAGSSASSTGLLTRPSLFGDGPVLTGAFPFRSVSRFPDGIATTKEQAMNNRKQGSTTMKTRAHFWQHANTDVKQPLPYCSSDLHCSSSSFSAGKISLVRSVSAAELCNLRRS
ncbi:hypothetical protein Tsp_09164 [Trichinella spiralis]|uniref:hypothetical protein n=1 Tax=Trichinella spiralis TaxID=6334 RepID=UPI0001EFCD7C|nr:hypothetical protein Tsp_09164 [Trichinella spiralis]